VPAIRRIHAVNAVREFAVERLPERRREGELIAADLGVTLEGLRGHVRERADDRPLLRIARRERRGGDRLVDREAEVDDLGLIADEHDVLGLEIAVDEAGCVSGREPLARAAEDLDDGVGAPGLGEPVPEREPGQELHRHVEAADLARTEERGVVVVDQDDVAVARSRQPLGLVAHRRGVDLVGDPRVELERDQPLHPGVQGLADDPARAATEHRLELVATVVGGDFDLGEPRDRQR
jgi:hypothetical protein